MREMSRRLKRWLIVLAALLVVGIAFIWTLPEIVKWQALKQIPAITGRAVAIEDIDINLFTGRVAIKKFRLAEPDPAQAFVEFERLDVRVVPWSAVFGNVRVAELVLTAPTVNLVRVSPTVFNFSDILARLATTAGAAAAAARRAPGQVALDDRDRPVRADPGQSHRHRSRGHAGERVEGAGSLDRGGQPHDEAVGAGRQAGGARRAQQLAGRVLGPGHRPDPDLLRREVLHPELQPAAGPTLSSAHAAGFAGVGHRGHRPWRSSSSWGRVGSRSVSSPAT